MSFHYPFKLSRKSSADELTLERHSRFPQQQLGLLSPLGAQASLPASDIKTQEQRTHSAEIQTKTSPVANKEKQELSSFRTPLPIKPQPITPPLTQKVIFTTPNLPLPSLIKK